MIYANFKKEQNRFSYVSISGHADSGPYGYDIVCAAVSALTISTVNNLSRIAKIKPEINANEKEGGFLEIDIPKNLKGKEEEYTQILLKSLYYSLQDIESEYGNFISILSEF